MSEYKTPEKTRISNLKRIKSMKRFEARFKSDEFDKIMQVVRKRGGQVAFIRAAYELMK